MRTVAVLVAISNKTAPIDAHRQVERELHDLT
jgi:hypothetical protein